MSLNQINTTGRAFNAYGCTQARRNAAGNRSEGEREVRMNAKIMSAMSHEVRCQGTAQYQMATPTKAIIYELDSLPVLKSTVNISTEARMVC